VSAPQLAIHDQAVVTIVTLLVETAIVTEENLLDLEDTRLVRVKDTKEGHILIAYLRPDRSQVHQVLFILLSINLLTKVRLLTVGIHHQLAVHPGQVGDTTANDQQITIPIYLKI